MGRIVDSSVDIEASAEQVWEVLMDLPAYGEWNPWIVAVNGSKRPRTAGLIELEVRMPSGKRQTATEKVIELAAPGRIGRYTYVLQGLMARFGLVSGRREQVVEVLAPGRCRYSSREHFGGLLWRFIPFAEIQEGMDTMSYALKLRAEALGVTAVAK